jgi:hypothetical protein
VAPGVFRGQAFRAFAFRGPAFRRRGSWGWPVAAGLGLGWALLVITLRGVAPATPVSFGPGMAGSTSATERI